MNLSTWANVLWLLAVISQSWAQSSDQDDSASELKPRSEERKEKGWVIQTLLLSAELNKDKSLMVLYKTKDCFGL